MTSGGGMGGQADVLFTDVVARLDEKSFRKIEQEVEQAGDAAGRKGGGALSNAFGGLMAGLPGLAATAAAAVGTALVAGAGAALNIAQQAQQGVRDIQAQLGLTAGEAEALGETAKRVFANNWGESLTEAQNMVVEVRRQMKTLTEGELEAATNAAAALADTFGTEVGEQAQAANTLMNDFGLTSQQAFDFLAKGFQDGLNNSGDFLETITEYSTQFKNGGASAEEFYSILSTGAQGGMLGTDKAADAFKEFVVRIQDGSKSTGTALDELGIDAGKLLKDMGNGTVTAADAFDLVLDRLRSTKDSNVQMQAGVALIGSQFEDLGKSGALALDLTATKMDDLKGATDDVNQRYNNLGQLMQGAWRQVLLQLEPVGRELLDLANGAMPAIKSAISQVGPVVTQVVRFLIDGFRQGRQVAGQFATEFGPQIQKAVATFQPVVQAIGPLFASVFNLIKTLWETVLRPALTAIAPLISGTVASIGNTLNVIVRIVTGVANTISALLRGDIGGAVKAMQGIFEDGVTYVVRQVRNMGSTILGLIKNIAPGMADAAGDIIRGLISGIENGAGAAVDAARNLAGGIIKGLKDKLLIRSPSRVMAEMGGYVSEGLASGIDKTSSKAQKAAAKLAADTLAAAKKELEKDIAFDKWQESLDGLTAKQLQSAQATARAAGDAQKYNAIKAELEQREDAAAAATKKATDAAKQHAEQLAANRKAITDGLKFDAYVAGLEGYTAAQLNAAKANAYSAGDGQRFNAVLAEQKRRADAATQAVKDWAATLAQGIADGNAALDGLDLNQMGGRDLAAAAGPLPDVTQNFADLTARIEALKDEVNEPGVVDAWTASIEEMGKRGLITGQQVAYLKQQVQDLVNIPSEQLLPDNLQGRGIAEGTIVSPDDPATGYLTPAEREEYLNLAVEQDPAWLQAELAHMERIGKGATDLADVYREALATIELANADALSSIQVGVDEAGNAIYATEAQLRGIGVAVDDVTESFFDLSTVDLTQFATLDALTTLAKQAQLTEADTAALVKRWLESTVAGKAHASTMEAQAAAVKAWDDNMAKLAWDDWIQSLQDFDEAQLDSAETTALLNLDTARYNAIQTERARRTREAAAADKDLADTQDASRKLLTDATAELEKMITGQEVPAYEKRALALEAQADQDEANAEALRLLAERFREVGKAAEENAAKMNVTLKIGGIDTGLKQLDLYKSAITGIANVMVDAFSNIVAGTEQGVDDVLKNMAKMALGIVKQVGVALIAYGAQAAAAALIGAATFNPVQIAAALAAGVALAALAAGLEARLGQSTGAGVMPSSPGGGAGSNAAPPPSNSVVQIPAAQVTVMATPEFVGLFGSHVDRFGNYVGTLVRDGIRVTTTQTTTPAGPQGLAWDLRSL
ncbi:phage tail tape measure protein [Deinococcus enclensis]|uniref:Phage-related minor tail protein n=1 Tax=Deinococcus enclensis TaxID=1049582 RepID=A0ABT9ME75_9DEIO|nr:phage tail tape measure protein [Deinococcus enclensis]MDP9764865.1 phage-related minor tail protein [Deinococcus enclensis]